MISFLVAAASMAVPGRLSLQTKNYAAGLNSFGERLWSELNPAEGNQAIAPISVGICLSMLIDGAEETTRRQLIHTLGLEGIDVEQGALGLSASLKEAAGNPFTISNGVWLHGKSQLNAAYRDSVRKNFGGEIRRFSKANAATLQEINGWVKEHTKGRIPTIFDQLDPDTSVVLVNALTFDGKWKTPFQKEATRDDDFQLSNGGSAKVPMMHQSGHFTVTWMQSYSTIALPYMGDRFEMRFLLPTADHTASQALAAWLQEVRLPSLGSNASAAVATKISIPKFKIECSYNLKPALGKMGLAPLYEDAKFGKIAPDLNHLTKIDQIQHKTYIKIDEEGTEAAASTGIAVTTRAILQKPITFDLDRPFAYAIVDKVTGVIVMMGTVGDPRG